MLHEKAIQGMAFFIRSFSIPIQTPRGNFPPRNIARQVLADSHSARL